MKRYLEKIINYAHSQCTTDLSAIIIAIKATDEYVKEFTGDILEDQSSRDRVARLLDIICESKSSKGILIVGNKRVHLRSHDSIYLSMSEITQIGESQSYFLPDSFTGTSQETEKVSAILEERLLKLKPIEFNKLELGQEVSVAYPSSSSMISRYSLRKKANQESQVINQQSFIDSLKKVIKEAPFGAEIAQNLIHEAPSQIKLEDPSSQESDSQKKTEQVQGDLDFVSEDKDSAFLRQVKRLATCDCQSGKRVGKLIAIQNSRDTEEIINSKLSVLYQLKPSGLYDKENQRLPKVVIIASQNNRLQQIQDSIENHFIKEANNPTFNLVKSQVSKAQKKKNKGKDQDQSFRKTFDVNQVFVLLDKKFRSHLLKGDLDISKVDYLIFDEVHNIDPESQYVRIMNNYIFNNKLMLSSLCQIEDKKRLPTVLAIFNLDRVQEDAQKNDQMIMKKLYFMANTFNASLLCLQKQDLVQVERDILSEITQIRVQNFQDKNDLEDKVQNCLQFLQNARKYITFRKDGEPRVTCISDEIIKKKKLKLYQYLETSIAKIPLDDAEFNLQDIGSKFHENLNQQKIDQQMNQYKPILQSTCWIFNNVSLYSSRIQFDNTLIQLLGQDIAKKFATQIVFPSQKDSSENKPYWVYSPRVYQKKTQSESQAALEMCKILYSLGHLDQNLRPSIKKQTEQLDLNETSSSRSINQDQTSDHKEGQNEEEKTVFTNISDTTGHSGTNSSRNQQNIINQSLESSSKNSHSKIPLDQKMKPRVCKKDTDAHEYFFNKNKNNKEKLQEGLNKGQHHMPIMHYNLSQLKLFISTILNPILQAQNEYIELCDNPDLIKFDDLNVNMIQESSIKEILFQECFYNKQENRKVNHTFIQFKNYRQRMFNIYDKNNVQINDQEFPDLVQMIDQSLERYKFPQYITQHIKNYHRRERGKTSQSSRKVEEDFNRKTFLTMLIIALSDKEPVTEEFEKVKNEMGRLAFVGDSIIILCKVMTYIFSGKKSFSEKDLDAVKNQILLKQSANIVGLDYLKIQAKYYKKTAPNPQIEGQIMPRDLGDVIKSLAGLFSIYLGFGATYLLLSDFGIVEPPTTEMMINIGKISVAQKVKILKTISQNRQDLLVYKNDKKMDLLKTLSNQKYPGQNKDHQTGSEIVDFWKTLVKSRGLFMKNDLRQIFPSVENTDNKDDDSLIELRDFSMALSYESSSSSSLATQEGVSSQGTTSSIQSYKQSSTTQIEEEKSQLALDDGFIMQQLQDRLQAKPVEYAGQTDYTGGEAIDEGIVDETAEPNQKQVEYFEREYKALIQEGYEFKKDEILLQCIVHKSESKRLACTEFKDLSQIDKDVVEQYNHQSLEYLGDSILKFTISKRFYCETADNQKQWHGDFFVPTKLNELKTWFSSNKWLSFALYENYYSTITEEIPRDPQFQNSNFATKAQESINQLKNKKMTDKEANEIAPRVPLIFDKNDKFEEQINEFNGVCYRQCLAADKNEVAKIKNYPREGLNVTSKSLSLKLFKDKDVQQQDQNEVDFSEIDEKFVKYFSDVMEALIGGIFMDSGDLDMTQMILLKLINCPSVSAFPLVQHDRTAVLSVFNSKPYCKGIKLYHSLEEKDGSIYIMGYMGKLQFRRRRYSKEQKKKVLLFYYHMRLYLEDAYKDFEMKFLEKRKKDDKREPTIDDWLDFNKDYRKTWKLKVYSADQKRYSAIKEAAKELYKFVSTEENFKTRENQNISDMREQIIRYLNDGLDTIGNQPRNPLLVLESERVQSSRIRELLQSSDIKFIDCLSYGMKDVGNFIEKLNNRQVHLFYEHLIEFGKN